MKDILLFSLLLGILLIGPVRAIAADEQRQAYDKMVEEATREADEYVDQKQKQAAEQHARKQREAEEQAKEAARLKESKEESNRNYGVPIRSRPIDNKPPVIAVPLPSGTEASGGDGSSAVSPASPSSD